ncbi:MAG: signal peptidase I [Deltaproteobacteria bacterium]|nr:signal peptidase I [Deltaproteobacteria bacterium]
MNFRYLVHRFWYFAWFVLLPLGIAWGVIDVLDKVEVVEEVEIWYVLLLFAALAFVSYSVREKLPFWQDKDPLSPYNKSRRRKEARLMARNVSGLLKRKGHKLSERGRAEVRGALEALAKAVEAGDDEAITTGVTRLDEKCGRYLAFARKSTGREYVESIGVAVLVAVVLRLFVVEAFKIPSESMVPTLMVGDHIFVTKYRYGLSIPFTNKRLVRFSSPARGEVVVFVKPSVEEQSGLPGHGPYFDDEYEMVGKDFIKRIVGLPGDRVEMREDVLYVNGTAAPRCRVGDQIYRTLNRARDRWEDHKADLWIERLGDFSYTIIEERSGATNTFGPAIVPDGQVFVLGDNRDNSNDSRYWGSVPFDNIKGRAAVIWWSNRRPHGFQWNRVGTFIMSAPRLGDNEQVRLARCPDMR